MERLYAHMHVRNEQIRNSNWAVALKRSSPHVEYETVSCFQINLCDPAAPLHAYLALADFFFLFPKVKLSLNGEHFSDISNIQRVMIALLKGAFIVGLQRAYEDL
jgi:hypothetical protein